MTTTTQVDRPDNVLLVPGAMQNWSDLDHGPAGTSAALRALVEQHVGDGSRVAVVGPHALDLISGLASQVSHLSVFTRSIPDAATIGAALSEVPSAKVFCGSVAHLTEQPEPYDVVIALDDVTRVLSLETEALTWREMFDAVRRLVAPTGTLLLAVEHELGLHRIASLHSRYTANNDADWSVTATFDLSRPRTPKAVLAAAAEAGLTTQALGSAYPAWDDQTVLAYGAESFTPPMHAVLAAVTLGSPAFRRVGADPTRVTRAAVMSGRLADLASGWVLVASGVAGQGNSPTKAIVESTLHGGVATYTAVRAGVQRTLDDGEPTKIAIPAGSRLLSEDILDACAAHDLPVLRRQLKQYAGWLAAAAPEGTLPAARSDARLDNVLVDGDRLLPLAPGDRERPLEAATWVGLADLVHVIRARGARHPWPSAMDDRTMLATIGAMAGLTLQDDLDRYLAAAPASQEPALPAHDVPGLLAVIERLTETNEALASRAQWFEDRLNTREREMRSRASRHDEELKRVMRQQDVLRESAEDVRRSITYRTGNVVIGPMRKLRDRTKS
ncbi:hypothetical protein [Luteipulveratus mongoliensis]|uniref:Uncharacterized protein n=1 Tax=Luteipulveratus mongoliensis TaxID=571913 RepID=A0A0K1JI00_9MICO|nr:hypothetical protein [Luteipulveratus mongoliensis]AKU16203.1 hypothetical protein VV02_10570 [Luteipulveratus mongoliensis]